jgi:hypothetical protein
MVAPVEKRRRAAHAVHATRFPDGLDPGVAVVAGLQLASYRLAFRLWDLAGKRPDLRQRAIAEAALSEREVTGAGEAEDPGSVAFAR